MTRKEFLEKTRISLILRTSASDPKDAPSRVDMTMKAVDIWRGIEIDGQRVISRIDILIPTDKRYKDSDCGETADFLKKFNPNNGNGFYVTEVLKGDNFCSILNDGMMLQARNGMDFAIIASSEASSYVTKETVTAIIDAAIDGALVVGVAINELAPSVRDGRAANTLTMWHIDSLMGVGGFDLRAAKPMDEKSTVWIDDGAGNRIKAQGAEEVIPIARIFMKFGRPCIASVEPQGEGIQRYEVPDPITHPEAHATHVRKIGTKEPRQKYFASLVGCDFEFIKSGVMPGYGWRAGEK
jgi:hypothetical protein